MLHSLVVASEKFKDVKTWEDVIRPFRNPSSIDKRTDKEIEEDTIRQYNKVFNLEG